MSLWIIKLGGSVITDKRSGRPRIRRRLLERLCEKIAAAYNTNGGIQFIVLHGAGSFGHPLAYQYQIGGAKLNQQYMLIMSEIMTSMRFLTDTVASYLRSAKVPAVPFQTSSIIDSVDDTWRLLGRPIIEQVLHARGIPVCGGDTVVRHPDTIAIASADALAVLFAQQFQAERILFATDVAGVYRSFPPHAGDQPLSTLTRRELQHILAGGMASAKGDVTGGMHGKLEELLALRDVSITIFDGTNPKSTSRALAGKPIGTTISL